MTWTSHKTWLLILLFHNNWLLILLSHRTRLNCIYTQHMDFTSICPGCEWPTDTINKLYDWCPLPARRPPILFFQAKAFNVNMSHVFLACDTWKTKYSPLSCLPLMYTVLNNIQLKTKFLFFVIEKILSFTASSIVLSFVCFASIMSSRRSAVSMVPRPSSQAHQKQSYKYTYYYLSLLNCL